MRLLIVVATEKEANALSCRRATVAVSGLGRVNAALTVAEHLHLHGRVDAVLSAGIAGSLPGSNLSIGDLVLATECVYAEEGIQLPEGFGDMRKLGWSLGDFAGNIVPTARSLDRLAPAGTRSGAIATVATCSGTDAFASEVARRTGAMAEAMEGAAVAHAANKFGIPGTEIRAISNTTGERPHQKWDAAKAFAALGRLGAHIDSILASA
ncbi:MAG: futalosine hydrolase [Planctomycetes bacterium]|nr:futalosine hydrolase [Planctomycetota bacterium]